jgi:hypothetical protein
LALVVFSLPILLLFVIGIMIGRVEYILLSIHLSLKRRCGLTNINVRSGYHN